MGANSTPGLVIAAPASGSGKTTVTLALLAALRRRGYVVQPSKCGPDYIDPAFHAVAAGRPSFNLDSWSQRCDRFDALLDASADADLCIAEGVMGLFDGVATSGAWGNGSTADIAAATGWPVVLVLDVAGQAQSAAAVALGFERYRGDVAIAGVILNKVASASRRADPRRLCTPRNDGVRGDWSRQHADHAGSSRAGAGAGRFRARRPTRGAG